MARLVKVQNELRFTFSDSKTDFNFAVFWSCRNGPWINFHCVIKAGLRPCAFNITLEASITHKLIAFTFPDDVLLCYYMSYVIRQSVYFSSLQQCLNSLKIALVNDVQPRKSRKEGLWRAEWPGFKLHFDHQLLIGNLYLVLYNSPIETKTIRSTRLATKVGIYVRPLYEKQI